MSFVCAVVGHSQTRDRERDKGGLNGIVQVIVDIFIILSVLVERSCPNTTQHKAIDRKNDRSAGLESHPSVHLDTTTATSAHLVKD